MGKTGGLNYPSFEDIVNTNIKLIRETGGNIAGAGRFQNENSLNWVLEAIQDPVYYPTISDKASILAWAIIDGHVFIDGNKRTGLMSMMIFLIQNGFYISARECDFKKGRFVIWIENTLN